MLRTSRTSGLHSRFKHVSCCSKSLAISLIVITAFSRLLASSIESIVRFSPICTKVCIRPNQLCKRILPNYKHPVMISTGPKHWKRERPQTARKRLPRSLLVAQKILRGVPSNKLTWKQCKNDSRQQMNGGERWNTRTAILFRSRTIAQDLTSFSKQFDHSGHWWVTPMSLFQYYSSWSVFSPPTSRKRVGFERDSFLPFQSFMEPALHP